MFSAGADLADLATDPGYAERLRSLFDIIEQGPKPVVAAIHG